MAMTGKQRSYLRGLAHHLDPVVQVGQRGVTDAVVRQLDVALETHELVMVRLARECPNDEAEAHATLEKGTSATVVQSLGRTLVVYRRRNKDPKIVLPR